MNDERTLAESVYPEYVNPYEFLNDGGKAWETIGGGGVALPNRPDVRSDRRHGQDAPFFVSEQQLAYYRGAGRYLTQHLPVGVNILGRLCDYTVGKGFAFKAQPVSKQPDDEAKQLCGYVQKCLDAFLDDNDFVGDMDRELDKRARRDGEFFVKIAKSGWRTKLSIIEPACVTEPGDAGVFCDHLGCGSPCNWTFGIHTLDRDSSQPMHYHVVYDDIGNDYELLPAGSVEHFKRNVDRTVKRGITDFYPVGDWIRRAEKLLRNTTGGAAVQAAIAFIREHGATATASSVSAFASGKAYDTYNQSLPSGGSRTKLVQKFEEGTVLDVGQQKYQAGPMGAGEAAAGFIATLQSALRYIGATWGMPEYMVSSDASNGNYSSTLVAESPFVKGREADQVQYANKFKRMAWKAVKNAHEAGFFGQTHWEQLEALVDIHVTPPRVSTRDAAAETQADKTLKDAGALSARGMAERAGLDYDREVANGAKEAAPPQQPGMGGVFGDGMESRLFESAVHAPHTMTVQGKEYRGGEFIPADVVAKATPEEKAKLKKSGDSGSGSSGDKPKDARQKQVDSPEFKAWFGDSKVVDAEGNPLVVYHGTPNAGFEKFAEPDQELGIHFGTATHARIRLENISAGDGAGTYAVYLSIKKPLRLPDAGVWNYKSVIPVLIKSKVMTAKEGNAILDSGKRKYDALRKALPVSFDSISDHPEIHVPFIAEVRRIWSEENSKIKEFLKKRGYDGVVYANKHESVVAQDDSYIAFNPNQIKSATGNRGTFDPKSNKITESTDASGHAHKGKGEGGGQFTSGGSSDSVTQHPVVKDVAEMVARHHPLNTKDLTDFVASGTTADDFLAMLDDPEFDNLSHFLADPDNAENHVHEVASRELAKHGLSPDDLDTRQAIGEATYARLRPYLEAARDMPEDQRNKFKDEIREAKASGVTLAKFAGKLLKEKRYPEFFRLGNYSHLTAGRLAESTDEQKRAETLAAAAQLLREGYP